MNFLDKIHHLLIENDSVDSFWDEYIDNTDENFLNHSNRVKFGALLTLYRIDSSTYRISDIQNNSGQAGNGKKFLEYICELADKHRIILELSAHGYSRTPTEKLVELYKTLGFVVEYVDDDSVDMVRYPKKLTGPLKLDLNRPIKLKGFKVTEAPISDIQAMHTDDNGVFGTGTSYKPIDRKLLSNENHIKRIVKAFQKTPFDFKVYFVDSNYFYNAAPNNVEHAMDVFKVQNVAEYQVDDSKLKFTGEPNVIKVVLMSNAAGDDDFMPMTPWILAHKIGHGVLENDLDSTNEIGYFIKKEIFKWDQAEHGWQLVPKRFIKGNYFTFKSARGEGDLSLNIFDELVTELVAQYLIQGKATLRNVDAGVEDGLNKIIKKLISDVVGKVMVQV